MFSLHPGNSFKNGYKAGCCLFADLCQDCRAEVCCTESYGEDGYGDEKPCERQGHEVGQEEMRRECSEIVQDQRGCRELTADCKGCAVPDSFHWTRIFVVPDILYWGIYPCYSCHRCVRKLESDVKYCARVQRKVNQQAFAQQHIQSDRAAGEYAGFSEDYEKEGSGY